MTCLKVGYGCAVGRGMCFDVVVPGWREWERERLVSAVLGLVEIVTQKKWVRENIFVPKKFRSVEGFRNFLGTGRKLQKILIRPTNWSGLEISPRIWRPKILSYTVYTKKKIN